MTTIDYAGGETIRPDIALRDSGNVANEPRAVVHDILDGAPVFTLRPATPNRGVLQLGFTSEVAAIDCRSAHCLASVFTIADTDSALLNFTYVVTGSDIGLTLDPETAAGWVVSIPFQEVI